jgi:cytochrome bd-type quinol oxidase subunit 2
MAMLLGAGTITLAHASVYTSPGGIREGIILAANNISGISTTDPATAIANIISVALSYSTILAIGVIVIAGFYLILGLGSESSKDTARKIIIYTGVGIVILSLAGTIVAFYQGLAIGIVNAQLETAIRTIIGVFTSYVGILAVSVIVIAGFYLILGLGNDSSKDTARKIIIYTAIGIIIIGLAQAIVTLFQGLTTGTGTDDIRASIRIILNTALSLVALLAVAVIVIAGIMYVVSGGEDSRKDTAKKIIIYCVIGLVVLGFASSFVNFVISAVTPSS